MEQKRVTQTTKYLSQPHIRVPISLTNHVVQHMWSLSITIHLFLERSPFKSSATYSESIIQKVGGRIFCSSDNLEDFN